MLIIMMLAGGAPPVGGFPARKRLAVADGALPETRVGQGRAQQQRKQQAESEKYLASGTHPAPCFNVEMFYREMLYTPRMAFVQSSLLKRSRIVQTEALPTTDRICKFF
jgi:hypothetical protein